MVYKFDMRLGDVVLFSHEFDSDNEEYSMLDMPFEKFADLGSPNEITVTIQPGDLLNDQATQ